MFLTFLPYSFWEVVARNSSYRSKSTVDVHNVYMWLHVVILRATLGTRRMSYFWSENLTTRRGRPIVPSKSQI